MAVAAAAERKIMRHKRIEAREQRKREAEERKKQRVAEGVPSTASSSTDTKNESIPSSFTSSSTTLTTSLGLKEEEILETQRTGRGRKGTDSAACLLKEEERIVSCTSLRTPSPPHTPSPLLSLRTPSPSLEDPSLLQDLTSETTSGLNQEEAEVEEEEEEEEDEEEEDEEEKALIIDTPAEAGEETVSFEAQEEQGLKEEEEEALKMNQEAEDHCVLKQEKVLSSVTAQSSSSSTACPSSSGNNTTKARDESSLPDIKTEVLSEKKEANSIFTEEFRGGNVSMDEDSLSLPMSPNCLTGGSGTVYFQPFLLTLHDVISLQFLNFVLFLPLNFKQSML